jgi:hypothetical protein
MKQSIKECDEAITRQARGNSVLALGKWIWSSNKKPNFRQLFCSFGKLMYIIIVIIISSIIINSILL